MKFGFISRIALIGALALGTMATATAATKARQPLPPTSTLCHAVFSSCMFNGTSYRVCTDRRSACQAGTLTPRIGQAAPEETRELTVADLASDSEFHAGRFKALTNIAFTGGNTYCLKMLYACDAGNASACDRFERYCNP